MGQKRLDKWNVYFEENCGDSPRILELRREADIENKKDFGFVSKIPHNFFWATINIFIIGIGISMLTMIKDAPIVEKSNPSEYKEVIDKSVTNDNQIVLPTNSINEKGKK